MNRSDNKFHASTLAKGIMGRVTWWFIVLMGLYGIITMAQDMKEGVQLNNQQKMEKQKKIGTETKAKLRSRFENSCNSYRHALERMWDLNPASGYWIGEEVGGIYDNDGIVTLNMGEIIYCVEHDISIHEYEEWMAYNIEAHEYNFDCINLKSWHMGCPRVPKETFERIRGIKQDLADAILVEKSKLNAQEAE